MSVISLKDRLVTLKVVYYGPAGGGKTASLQHLHRILDPDASVELVTLATAGDQTLFFDFLPIDLGTIGGFRFRLQAFTVPGRVPYGRTRRVILADADGVVFVANSDPDAAEKNPESVGDFHRNTIEKGLDPETIPLVIQYNQRDLENAIPVADLRDKVRFRPVAEFQTVAADGKGVYEAFRAIVSAMVKGVAREANLDPREAVMSIGRHLDHVRADSHEATRPAVPATVTSISSPPPGADSGALLEAAIESGIRLTRLYAEVSVARKGLEVSVRSAVALNHLSRHLLAADSPAESWTEVYRTCREHLACTSGTLLRRAGAEGTLRVRELDGHDSDPLQETLADGFESFLSDLNRPTLVSHRESPMTLHMLRRRDPTVQEFVMVPVRLRDALDGVIILYRTDREGPFHEKDLRFLTAATHLAALGLDRAGREQNIIGLNRDLEERVRTRTVRLTNALVTINGLTEAVDDRVEQRTSELKRANETLRQTQDYLRQAEKMASIARLAAGIAHEVHIPMSCVQGNLRAIAESVGDMNRLLERVRAAIAGPITEETAVELRTVMSDAEAVATRENLGRLIEETTADSARVVRVADGIRSIAHYESRDLETVDLHRQIESALAAQSTMFQAGVTIVRDFGEIPLVPGDPTLLVQVFSSLLDNAVHAMEGQGRITIRTRPEEDGATVEITDTGPGIPEDILPHVFEPFYSTKRHGEGTGLGLYSTYQIVERHGGVVSISSPEDLGTTVTVSLLGACRPAVEEIEAR